MFVSGGILIISSKAGAIFLVFHDLGLTSQVRLPQGYFLGHSMNKCDQHSYKFNTKDIVMQKKIREKVGKADLMMVKYIQIRMALWFQRLCIIGLHIVEIYNPLSYFKI